MDEPEYEITKRDPSRSSATWTVVKFSSLLYHIWLILATITAVLTVFTVLVGEWLWAMAWLILTSSLSAHARIEHMDGHRHMGGKNYVE